MTIVCPNKNCGRFQVADFEGTARFKCGICKTEFTVTTPVRVLDKRFAVANTKV